jgi:hypothetical protein
LWSGLTINLLKTMAASKSNVNQANRMAEQGKSAQQIQNRTGVSSDRATTLVSKAAPGIQSYQAQQQQTRSTPQVGQRPGETATIYPPGVTPPPQPSAPAQSAEVKYNNPVQKAVATYADWNTGGKNFGGSDIKSLQDKGYSSNQIMKIAASVGNLASVTSRANTKLLAGLPSRRKGTNALTAAVLGSQTDNPLYAGLAREQGYSPKKQLSWGGITAKGKPMALSGMDYSKDLYGKGKAYTWTPGKGLGEKALDKLVTGATTTTNTGGATTTNTGGAGGSEGPTQLTPELIPPEIPEEEKDPMMMPGMGADLTSFATGWKSRLSSRKGKGAAAQGLASQRLGPVGKWQYNV